MGKVFRVGLLFLCTALSLIAIYLYTNLVNVGLCKREIHGLHTISAGAAGKCPPIAVKLNGVIAAQNPCKIMNKIVNQTLNKHLFAV